MALINCKECAAQISSQASACPQCGAKPPGRTTPVAWLALVAVLVGAYALATRSTSYASLEPSPSGSVAAARSTTPPGWTYRARLDPMTSQQVKFAAVDSANSLHLAFPYQGDNYGRLTVRVSAKHDPEVLLQIDKGQLLCRRWEYSCDVQVRFDDRPPLKFRGQGPSDGSSETAFLNHAQSFVTEARRAKRIRVSVEVFKEGSQVLDFGPLDPLQWPLK
jgi:hypothetical protein